MTRKRRILSRSVAQKRNNLRKKMKRNTQRARHLFFNELNNSVSNNFNISA